MDTLARIERVLDNVVFLGSESVEYPWREVADIGFGVSIGIIKNTAESNFSFEYLIVYCVRYNTLLSNDDKFDSWCYLWKLDDEVKNVKWYNIQTRVAYPVVVGGVFLRRLVQFGAFDNQVSLIMDAYDVKQGASGLEVRAKSFTIVFGRE